MSSCNVLQAFKVAFVFSGNYRLSLPSRHFSNCLKNMALKRRVHFRYNIAIYFFVVSQFILGTNELACDTNPELLVQRCTTRKQLSDDLRQPLLPTHTNRTSVFISMKCWVHPRLETRKTSFFARPDHCCLSRLIWLTLLLFNDCAKSVFPLSDL